MDILKEKLLLFIFFIFFKINISYAEVVVVNGSGFIQCPAGYTLTSVSSATSDYSSCEGMPSSGVNTFPVSGNIAPKCEYWNGAPIQDPNVIAFCVKNESGHLIIKNLECPSGYIDTGGTPPMTGFVFSHIYVKSFCYKSCSGNSDVIVQQPNNGYVSCPEKYKIISLVTPTKIMSGNFPFLTWTGNYDWNYKVNNATIFNKGGCYFDSNINPTKINCTITGFYGIITTPAVLCGKI